MLTEVTELRKNNHMKNISRRDFLKLTAISIAALGAFTIAGYSLAVPKELPQDIKHKFVEVRPIVDLINPETGKKFEFGEVYFKRSFTTIGGFGGSETSGSGVKFAYQTKGNSYNPLGIVDEYDSSYKPTPFELWENNDYRLTAEVEGIIVHKAFELRSSILKFDGVLPTPVYIDVTLLRENDDYLFIPADNILIAFDKRNGELWFDTEFSYDKITGMLLEDEKLFIALHSSGLSFSEFGVMRDLVQHSYDSYTVRCLLVR